MQNKIQELTDRLYQEGLSKGQAEGEQILSEARAKAASIIVQAEKDAAEIRDRAERSAADTRAKAESDVRAASEQALQATKKDIENLLVSKISADKVSSALKDPAFLKEIIGVVAQKFSSQEATDIALVLPESLQKELEPFVRTELAEALSTKVEARWSKKISGGFTIAPKDGGYFISLTDETFRSLIAEYLRPVTKKILFG